eukprot:TRINITY_DN2432_c0_g2_i1.p1 TRINITY_DN2432_c0_g2~~TRINITY_DN2432_c0_g2_i1.p1  ORF type:complete len:326 (+),score=60.54 TRINITY_DN2432_c0_g2_i1:44-1021(+)
MQTKSQQLRKPKSVTWGGDNARIFFDSLANHLKLKDKNDWYNITKEDVFKFGGERLLNSYDGLVGRALQRTYPDHHWLIWKFDGSTVRGTWDHIQPQKERLNEIAKGLNINELEDWYSITKAQISEKGGGGLLNKYGNSPSTMLTSVLTEHRWDLRKFVNKPRQDWSTIQSHKMFLDRLAKQLNITKMEDWYNIGKAQILAHGGGGLLNRYHNSPSKMIISLFPNHIWRVQNFTYKPKGIGNDKQSQKDFLLSLGNQLHLQKMEDWYRVSKAQILAVGGGGLLVKYGMSPSLMITSIFMEHDWNLQSLFQNQNEFGMTSMCKRIF